MLRRALLVGSIHVHRLRTATVDWLRPSGMPSLFTPSAKTVKPSPLHPLTPAIDALRCDAIALLQPQPSWRSQAKDRLALRERLDKALQHRAAEARRQAADDTRCKDALATTDQASGGDEVAGPGMHDRWFMQELLHSLRAFDNFFLRSYDVDAGLPLMQAVLPAQKRMLDAAVRDVFRTASDSDLQRLLAVIDRDVLALLPASQLASRALPATPQADTPPDLPAGSRLNVNEFLALVDYLHPYTHHYQVINGGLRLARYWGVEGIADASALLREPYLRALHKLQRSGLFTDRSGLYAKGIVATGHLAPLTTALDFLGGRGGHVLPPHPLSATRCQQQSFALQPGRPEDTTILLKAPEAIDVTPFHGSLGKSLGEVILLPQPLQVADPAERAIGTDVQAAAARIPVYLLQVTEPALRKRQINHRTIKPLIEPLA